MSALVPHGDGCSTYLAVDELQITGALAVAVSSSVLGSSRVGGVLGHAAISVHGDKVHGAIETALCIVSSHQADVSQLLRLTGSWLRSTSKANSLPMGENKWYLDAESIR